MTKSNIKENTTMAETKTEVKVVEKKDLIPHLKELIANSQEPIAILTVGAGDIDRLVPDIAHAICNL